MELSEARNQQKDKSRFAYLLCIFACVCVGMFLLRAMSGFVFPFFVEYGGASKVS
jgi:hypothetical protein